MSYLSSLLGPLASAYDPIFVEHKLVIIEVGVVHSKEVIDPDEGRLLGEDGFEDEAAIEKKRTSKDQRSLQEDLLDG